MIKSEQDIIILKAVQNKWATQGQAYSFTNDSTEKQRNNFVIHLLNHVMNKYNDLEETHDKLVKELDAESLVD